MKELEDKKKIILKQNSLLVNSLMILDIILYLKNNLLSMKMFNSLNITMKLKKILRN